ncbi:hypothetical protein ETP68_06920 [Listeria monocytogenes]|nr:hypothetical protein ETP68_06920 [Listeria monocytogenes]
MILSCSLITYLYFNKRTKKRNERLLDSKKECFNRSKGIFVKKEKVLKANNNNYFFYNVRLN